MPDETQAGLETAKGLLNKDAFAKHNGIELINIGPGTATAVMTVGAEHLNGVGIGHGAAIFSLADFAFAAASNSHGVVAVAINANISFVKAAAEGTRLTATATEQSINRKLATYAVEVTDEEGERVATFQGMVYRKRNS